jgi:uncharacterized protein (DUF488 family)
LWEGEDVTTTRSGQRTGLIGFGYEGRDIDSFIDELVAAEVSVLVDVRLTPISRKRGFSKTALRNALSDAGIAYRHCPELGNPKPNRAGFSGSHRELNAARETFAARLRRPEARAALDALISVAESERVGLLCFEADQHRCHRDVVLGEAARFAGFGSGSGSAGPNSDS